MLPYEGKLSDILGIFPVGIGSTDAKVFICVCIRMFIFSSKSKEVEEMTISIEQKRKDYRLIYEFIYRTPRIQVRDVASLLGVDRNTASRRMREAFELGYVTKPQVRRKSFRNFAEYVYFLNIKNLYETFYKYIDWEDIVYHASMSGFANLWVISKEELDIGGISGLRSDYYVSYTKDHSWDTAIDTMRKMVEEFDPDGYKPKGILQTHWNEAVGWDSEDEKLFKEFKYDMREPLSPVIKRNLISWGKIYEWFDKLPEKCSVFTNYYPATISGYDPYLFTFETDYEDFLIDLFSELPTSTFFFSVENRLFVRVYVERQYLRVFDFRKPDVRELQIPCLVKRMLKLGIVKSEAHALIESYWRKEI